MLKRIDRFLSTPRVGQLRDFVLLLLVSLVVFKIHNKTSFQKFARLVEAAPGDITAGEPEDESK